MTGDIVELAAALTRDAQNRQHAARELAKHLGAEDLLILVPERRYAVHLPACGFPQTLPGGRLWRAFVSEAITNSFAAAELSYPVAGNRRVAKGWTAKDGSIMALFDGEPNLERVEQVRSLLPLLTATFERERAAIASEAHTKIAEKTAAQARELAESLDGVRRRLQQTLILREQDLEARQRVEAALEQSNAELKRLNEDLKQFTFAATHDLREPLRMIAIYVQLFQEEAGGRLGEESREHLTRVLNGTQRMSRLIDGLLEFSRVAEIDAKPSAPVESESALNDALKDLEIAIGETNAAITRGPLPEVLTNRVHLRQLFQNLVGNAIKYRNPAKRPEIGISASRDRDQWRFAIEDNGIGVDPRYHDYIFVPFKRLHGSETSGAGIGLATCKRIVERYNGRIWVESPGQNGSVFYFLLPAAGVAP
ncbi:MAG: ATP-binding protein [Bryobacteraceae bacterium]